MSRRTITLTEPLYEYLLGVSLREADILKELREETARHSRASMQIAPDQGQFMALLVRLMGARRTIEIGVFTGYSALAVAMALPEDGRMIACDVSEEYTSIARRYWRKAGVEHKIDLRIAPAIETLDALLEEGQEGAIDFGFVDADKENYEEYVERVLRLLRPGGLILVDNVLRSGEVADPSITNPETSAIRALNAKLYRDPRIDLSMVPIGDGLTLARKR